jgi:hypothetical protein
MTSGFDTTTVFVARPPETLLGDFFAEMRSWLDHRAIEIVNFQTIAKGEFEVHFKNFADARLFSEQFAKD